MGFQAIIEAKDESPVLECLGDVADASEIFRISSDQIGISVPTNVLDTIGEDQFRGRLGPRKPWWRLWR